MKDVLQSSQNCKCFPLIGLSQRSTFMITSFCRALLVEDNQDHANILIGFLSRIESISLDIETVPCLDEAVNRIKDGNFDIVLLDLMLPDSKGMKTFYKLHEQIPEVPIVVITALNDQEMGTEAVRMGAQDYLVKGNIDSAMLSRAIQYAIVRQQNDANLRRLALIDDLTKLYNRRGFLSLAQQNMKLAKREGKTLLLMSGDLDGLKLINDTYGHHEGDRALKTVAALLKDTFRTSDVIARIGGDEFVVLAIQATGENAQVLRERLQKNIDQHNATNEKFSISLSVGIAQFNPQDEVPIEELLIRADQRLYEDKQTKWDRQYKEQIRRSHNIL
jgi:two-component system cell cycle response regulator